MAGYGKSDGIDSMNRNAHLIEQNIDKKAFEKRLPNFEKTFKEFIRTSSTGIEGTLFEFWRRIVTLHIPFLLDADEDMAKFTFAHSSGFHICTSARRFHRPKMTGKPLSVTIMMGGFKEDYNDPENQLIPCDKARKISCCYFGMAEDEVDLAMFFLEQLMTRTVEQKKGRNIYKKARIAPRKK